MSPYWTSVIDQIIPSTTLWTGGNLISNNIFGRPKYQYRYGCQPLNYEELVYPDDNFLTEIQYWNEYFGWEDEILEIGEYRYDGHLYLFPTFTLDGINFSGSTSNSSTYVLVSGHTSNLTGTTKNAKLFNWAGEEYYYTGSSQNTINFTETTNAIHTLWEDAIIGTINYINTCTNCEYSGYTKNESGYISDYGPWTMQKHIYICRNFNPFYDSIVKSRQCFIIEKKCNL